MDERKGTDHAPDADDGASQQTVVAAIDGVADRVVMFDPEDRLLFANKSWWDEQASFGLAPKIGDLYRDYVRDLAASGCIPQAVGKEEDWVRFRLERRLEPREATEIPLSNGEVALIRDHRLPDGGILTITTTITDRVRAETALKESEARFKDFSEAGSDWLWETDAEHRFTALYGGDEKNPVFRPDFSIGKTRFEANCGGDPHNPPQEWRQHLEAINSHLPFKDFVYAVDIGDGGRYWLRTSGLPVTGKDGVFRGYRGVTSDITQEIEAEERAQSIHKELASAIEGIPDAVAMWDGMGRLTLANQAWLDAMKAVDVPASTGMLYKDHLGSLVDAGMFPEAAGHEQQWIEERIERRRHPGNPYESVSILGVTVLVRDYALPDGGVITFTTDISERKEAEAALQKSEERLQQSQKMEAVGQLTGGVAHDFNNLLTVILGNLELLTDRIADDQIAQSYAEQALSSVQRGATLTDRLLAFSRKQALVPRALNASDLVDSMTDLLRRTLEESVEIELVNGDALWHCEADPSQLENAVLNLSINARDAMSGSGKLTIETANVKLDDAYAAAQAEVQPGQYVMIAVTDTGAGMSQEVIEKVFEPFFTTKAAGKGSGLGLSMVYGFVKQSCGHVTIYSEQGVGTTVKLYLPRSRGPAEELHHGDRTDVPAARGERILVVEDDPDVRTLAVVLLRGLGYEILEAPDAGSALIALETSPRVHLLFTDVVLPGDMNGPDLAAEVHRRRPGIGILYTSGYTENAIIHQGRVDDGLELLNKPYSKADLARKVRDVLDKTKK